MSATKRCKKCVASVAYCISGQAPGAPLRVASPVARAVSPVGGNRVDATCNAWAASVAFAAALNATPGKRGRPPSRIARDANAKAIIRDREMRRHNQSWRRGHGGYPDDQHGGATVEDHLRPQQAAGRRRRPCVSGRTGSIAVASNGACKELARLLVAAGPRVGKPARSLHGLNLQVWGCRRLISECFALRSYSVSSNVAVPETISHATESNKTLDNAA